MSKALIVFPHQLFQRLPIENFSIQIYLVEEYLFFKQYPFHKQKLAFHRASMKRYQDYLSHLGYQVEYIESKNNNSDVRLLIPWLKSKKVNELHVIEPTDYWLEKRISSSSEGIDVVWYKNPLFINSKDELIHFFKPTKKKFFQTAFYKEQRKSRHILMTGTEPEGGRWTYDTDNRKKYPKSKTPPSIYFPEVSNYHIEAKNYVLENFPNNYGELGDFVVYPICFESAVKWFDQFLEQRFLEFGSYEDAIVKEEYFLNHSLLSPLMNTGLLDPLSVIKKATTYASNYDIPINSTEGFIRQILGWREFIRGVYEAKGSEERTKNFWGFTRKIPPSFYEGTTGIAPIDDTITKVLQTGYAHHIERLMILGNFMVLCEFDPDSVYQWFMELFIDAYDWVMVPNVYGMSLYADGGLMSTKPYISSSNYIMKMSNYQKGDWQKTWDGLFWAFMDKHRTFFLRNPRLGMLIRTFDKMNPETKERHLSNAKDYLAQLDQNR